MNTRRAERLLRVAEDAKRSAHRSWIHAEIAMNRYERSGQVASPDGQQADERRITAKDLYENADRKVRTARSTVRQSRARENKIQPMIGAVIAGLMCAFLFPLAGATTLPQGLLDCALAVAGYGMSMYLMHVLRPPYEEFTDLINCKWFLFAGSIVGLLNLPLVAIATLFLTGTIGVNDFPMMCAGIIATTFAFFMLPRLVTPYI